MAAVGLVSGRERQAAAAAAAAPARSMSVEELSLIDRDVDSAWNFGAPPPLDYAPMSIFQQAPASAVIPMTAVPTELRLPMKQQLKACLPTHIRP